MNLGHLNTSQWALLAALTLSAAVTTAVVSGWAACASRPRWFWRIAVLVVLFYPALRAGAFPLWIVFVVQAALIVAALVTLRVVGAEAIRRFPEWAERFGFSSAVATPWFGIEHRAWQFRLSDLLALTCISAAFTAGFARCAVRPFSEWAPWIWIGCTLAILSLIGLWAGTRPARWYGGLARWGAMLLVPAHIWYWIDFDPKSSQSSLLPEFALKQLLLCWILSLTIAIWTFLLLRFSASWSTRRRFDTALRVATCGLSLLIAGFLVLGTLTLLDDPGSQQLPIPSPNGYDEVVEVVVEMGRGRPPFHDAWQATELEISQTLRSTSLLRARASRAVSLPSARRQPNSLDDSAFLNHYSELFYLCLAWQAESVAAARRGDRAAAAQAAWNMLELSRVQRKGGLSLGLSQSYQSIHLGIRTLRDLPNWPNELEYQELIPRLIAWETSLESPAIIDDRDTKWLHHVQWVSRVDAFLQPFESLERRGYREFRDPRPAAINLTITELALAKYRAQRGEYPDTLDQLVPGILPSVPLDPCSGKALRYRCAGAGYVLYCVGADGVDNRGISKFEAWWTRVPGSDVTLPRPRHSRAPQPAPNAPGG